MNRPELQERLRWHPQGWRDKEHRHMPSYPDRDVADVTLRLTNLPGLVSSADIQHLRTDLQAAAAGQCFVLQAGHSEEHFHDVNPMNVNARLKAIGTLRKYLAMMLPMPVTVVGLMAGSYARSRAHPTEEINGFTVTSYYGEMVNAMAPNPWGRKPDANRMLWAYEAAQMALGNLQGSGIYVGHEAAHLHFEAALVRTEHDGFYATSGHLLGLETLNLFPDSCYLEFCRGVRNPIAVHVSPQLHPARLQGICRTLNPDNEPGKLVLITSLGTHTDLLDGLIDAVQSLKMPVVWMCDPLREHVATPGGVVMRDVIDELERTLHHHARLGSRLGGLYLDSAASPVLDFQKSLQLCSNLVHAYRSSV